MSTVSSSHWNQETVVSFKFPGPPQNETNEDELLPQLVAEQVEVPEQTVGAVIGKAGQEIRNIQVKSGCEVQISPDGTALDGLRKITLKGTEDSCNRARKLILEIVDRVKDNTSRKNFNHAHSNFIDVLIEGDKCGLIVGKSGETIKQLQERSGCKIQLIQDSTVATLEAKPLRISGKMENIAIARRLVMDIIGRTQAAGDYSEELMDSSESARGEVVVPRNTVGMIIGKGGETIRKIGQDTGTKIQFKQDDENSNERCAIIIGRADQIYRATQIITDIVERTVKRHQTAGSESVKLTIPTKKAGLVIGKGGETIKQINHETGAYVEFARDGFNENDDFRVCVIRGSPEQVKLAVNIIKTKIGEPGHANTSFVPEVGNISGIASNGYISTMNQHMPQQVGHYASFRQNSQFELPQGYMQPQMMMNSVQPAPQGLPSSAFYPQSHSNNPQYSANNSSYQPSSPQLPQSMFAPQQQLGENSAPAGQQQQQDYSVQWAQYYRLMGLVNHAEMIESQMKNKPAKTVSDSTSGPSSANAQQLQQSAHVLF